MLNFYYGTMGSGKTTAALQLAHNLQSSKYNVEIWSGATREENVMASRIGLQQKCHIFDKYTSFIKELDNSVCTHLIVDEAQFLKENQIDELFFLADEHGIFVSVFGLLAAFNGTIFPASQKLLVFAGNNSHKLPVTPHCECGEPGIIPARFINNVMQTEGSLFVVGDLNTKENEIEYRSLCREHYMINKNSR